MTVDTTSVEAQLNALLTACDGVQQLGKTVEPEALGMLILGANANIYDTTKGAYDRTQALLAGLSARGTGTRDTATVSVHSSVPYGLSVELGTLGMTAETLFKIASRRGVKTQAMTLGRTGKNYRVAGPILTPAAVFAAERMQQLFVRRVREVLR
jgi:hypothetical protein